MSEPPAPQSLPTTAEVHAVLRELLDPEIGLNVVDLGMVGEVSIGTSGAAHVELIPTTPGCPMHDALASGVAHLVGALPGITSVDVTFSYDPPWTPDRIAPEARALLGLR